MDFVSGRWFPRVRATIDCLDARPSGLRGPTGATVPRTLHQHGDVHPPSLQPFSPQEPLQHPTSSKRVVEMQFIDPAHQSQIAVRHRTRQIIDTATAEAEKLCLAHDG